MKIALITQREDIDKYGVPIDIMESTYIKFFNRLGFISMPISNYENNAEKLLEMADVKLLVLTGGGSVSAKYYKEDYGYKEQLNRDTIEERLLLEALKKGIAVLAICRGMQFVNGYFGGKVSKLDNLKVPRKSGEDHPVRGIRNAEVTYVNNYHNDGIYSSDLADGVQILAMDVENDVVEAFSIKEKKLLAVQWHPERSFKTEEAQNKTLELINDFLLFNIN